MRFSYVLPLLALLAACGSQNTAQGEVLRFITTALTPAYTGELYSEEVRLTSGTRPYSVRLAKGGLPPGLSLQGRTITGTVQADAKDAAVKVYEFTLEASDANLSNKLQDFKLEVRRLPAPTLEWQPAQTEVKTETRVPLVLKVPRRVSSMRLFVPIPEGFAFKRLEPGAGKPIFMYRLQGKLLRVDAAFTEKLNTIKDQTVLYLTLTVTGSRRLSGKPGFELRDAGKVTGSAKPELPQAAPATPPGPPAAPGSPPASPPAPTTPPASPPPPPASPPSGEGK